jgi:toxin ParE1/3/4
MARVELAAEVAEDFDRILAFLAPHDAAAAAARVMEIMQAVEVLAHNPLIGRPISNGKRELVIGRRSHGYVALYQYVEAIDTAFVLAVRSQREAGYIRN